MARKTVKGSLTKEPPLAKLDATLELVRPGMTYDQLRTVAARSPNAHPDAPGLVQKRFLSLDPEGRIEYDGLLALIKAHGPQHPKVRKLMYFIWAWRDPRIRGFIVERIADPTGRWRPRQVTRKQNADFFEQFLADSSAQKARSNYEFFLTEAGIFNPRTESVNLDLSDGWLTDAMTILSRDESDPAVRSAMLLDPLGFIVRAELNALLNMTRGPAAPNLPGELEAVEVVDDQLIPPETPGKEPASRAWQPRQPPSAGGRQTEVTFDFVALERANVAHQRLERLAAAAIRRRGHEPRYTRSIDMYYRAPGRTVVMEMKSCQVGNIHTQVRRGVSQLLEYRYLHPGLIEGGCDLALVMETAPSGGKGWLTDYLVSVGIWPSWAAASDDALITTAPVPPSMEGVIRPTG